ncbi:MAG: glycolate oxidase subunit GlcE [Hydrogenophilales bacterium 28-61-23]|nr:MAG: glycolate oxidase subunit GlcE [Hydrogenophilales bacterium 28-61-23]
MLPFEPPHFSPPPQAGEGLGQPETWPALFGGLVGGLVAPPERERERESSSDLLSTNALSPALPQRGRGQNAATLGGMVATGLSGPRRPWGGAVRDAVLGVKLLNGRGEVLCLGGQVMKNVAGYDVSRLMVGAMGTLGVLLEVSIKVLPRPACERTLVFETGGRPANTPTSGMPVSASLELDGRLYLRLSASSRCVEMAADSLGGEAADPEIWAAARDQTLPFFQTDLPLWRISLPPAAPSLNLPGSELIEWNGAQRWLISELPAKALRQRVGALGGHATLFRNHAGVDEVFQPLQPAMLALHQRVKQALDPHAVFNPGRLYPEL